MLELDFPKMLERIQESGITIVDVSKECGMNRSKLTGIKNESLPIPQEWKIAATIIDLYFQTCPIHGFATTPLYYEHNE